MYFFIILLNFLSYFLRIFRLFAFSYYLDNGRVDNSYDNQYKNYDRLIPTPKTISSWNIHGIPLFLTKTKTNIIIEKLIELDSDIICIQECFSDDLLHNIQEKTKHKYPIQINTLAFQH